MLKSLLLVSVLLVSACSMGVEDSRSHIMGSDQTQVQMRAYQTRAFDTTDKRKTLRTVIATLQDLNFIVDKADLELGTVSASKAVKNTSLKITVSVTPKGKTQTAVRANAQYGLKAVDDPKTYQDFFAALEKAMFLTAHEVD